MCLHNNGQSLNEDKKLAEGNQNLIDSKVLINNNVTQRIKKGQSLIAGEETGQRYVKLFSIVKTSQQ